MIEFRDNGEKHVDFDAEGLGQCLAHDLDL
jgi:hypothetical protein